MYEEGDGEIMSQASDWAPKPQDGERSRLGRELRALRKGAGLTQRAVGIALGLWQTSVSDYELGKQPAPEGARDRLIELIKDNGPKEGAGKRTEKAITEHKAWVRTNARVNEIGSAYDALSEDLAALETRLTAATKFSRCLEKRLTEGVKDLVDFCHKNGRRIDALASGAAAVDDFSAPPPEAKPADGLPALNLKPRDPRSLARIGETAAYKQAPPWRPSARRWIKAAAARMAFEELRPFRVLDLAVFLRLVPIGALRRFLADLSKLNVAELPEGSPAGVGPAIISKYLTLCRDWLPTDPTATAVTGAARYAHRAQGEFERLAGCDYLGPDSLARLKRDARSKTYKISRAATETYRHSEEYRLRRLIVLHSAGWVCSDCRADLTEIPKKPETAEWDHAHYHNPMEERQGVDVFAVCSTCHRKREHARGRA